MLYEVQIKIIHNNPGIRNAVENVLPLHNNNRLWPDEYVLDTAGVTEDGDKYLLARMVFYDVVERTSFLNNLKALDGILRSCLSGSFIKQIKNYHKWNQDNPDQIAKQCECEVTEVP